MKAKDIQPRNSADVTEKVIETWKAAYPRGIFCIAIDTDEVHEEKEEKDDKGKKHLVTTYVQKKGWVRKPNRHELSAALTMKNDPLGSAESLLRDSWLGGDEELLEDDDYFEAAVLLFQKVMETRNGEIKKV